VTPGTYTLAQIVAISDSTPGAIIYYTTNGSTPRTGSTLYNGPITVSTSETIQAIAIASGYSDSAIASAGYNIEPPVNPAPSVFVVTPAFVTAGSDAFTVTVNGSGFTAGSTVYWGTSTLATQFVSDTQLRARVLTTDVTTAGVCLITVQTPIPGGGTSNQFQFEVDTSASNAPGAPSFSSITATVAAGAAATYPVSRVVAPPIDSSLKLIRPHPIRPAHYHSRPPRQQWLLVPLRLIPYPSTRRPRLSPLLA
jgi:hypothetical protein